MKMWRGNAGIDVEIDKKVSRLVCVKGLFSTGESAVGASVHAVYSLMAESAPFSILLLKLDRGLQKKTILVPLVGFLL